MYRIGSVPTNGADIKLFTCGKISMTPTLFLIFGNWASENLMIHGVFIC